VQRPIILSFAMAATLMLPGTDYSRRLVTESKEAAQSAQVPAGLRTEAAVAPNDYGAPGSWLCRPGLKGACDVDLTTTIVAANGTLDSIVGLLEPNTGTRQFIISTCDEKLLQLARQKFSHIGGKHTCSDHQSELRGRQEIWGKKRTTSGIYMQSGIDPTRESVAVTD